jgi:hypothetical protein
MSRTTLNYLIDALSFIGFTFLAATGVLLRYVLPPGSGRWSTLWGLQRHDWSEIHFWVAVFFLLVLSMHLFFHWSWITAFVKGHKREESGVRVALGIVALIALLALALAPFFSPVEQTPRPGRGRFSLLLPRDVSRYTTPP